MSNRSYRRRRKRHPFRLPLLLLSLAFLTLFFLWSNCSLQVEHFTYSSDDLPIGFDGCTVAVLSDLHGAAFGEDNEKLFAEIEDLSPEYIFLTGDLADRFRETPAQYTVDLCARLAAIAPTYYVTGNHEWALGNVRALKSAIRETGTVVLTNEYVSLERGGDSILLAGIDDPNGFADQKTPEELAAEVQESWDGFWLLLAHRNNHFEKQYCSLGADLVISGHAHGGMIRLPFTDGLIGTDRNLFPTYTAGFYEKNGTTLFVSRGLGNSGPSFRLFNRPQIAVLTLQSTQTR